MNFKRVGILLMIALLLFGCPGEDSETPSDETGKKPTPTPTPTPTQLPDGIHLTVGSNINLTSRLNTEMTGTISWSSGNSAKVVVSSDGVITSNITSFTADEGGNQQYKNAHAWAQVTITATSSNGPTQKFVVVATTEPQEAIGSISPFKSYFPSSFLVGNIAATGDGNGSTITNMSLTRHFNTLTSENDMKPDAVTNGRNASTGEITYTWTKADNFVNAARASSFKVIGHTLLWHSQIPQWQKDMATAGKATALTAMKKYITEVVTHFKGKIYSWDVLNEAFPDSSSGDWKTAMRQENPWVKAIGYEFVYEAFLAARQADPDAKLYYNDYNTDNTARATLIYNMVRDVNQQYKAAFPSETRLLIEGIGMQEHHNLGVSASSVRNALTLFRELTGIKVAVSEIDVLGYNSYSEFSSATGQGANKNNNSTITNNQLLTQATRYKEYMAVYMDFKDIIERISIWGIFDDKSWRSGGLPLLFDPSGKAKPAYYKFVEAISKPW